VRLAAQELRERLLHLASEALEVAVEDLVVEAGAIAPRGVPNAGLSFAELASLAKELTADPAAMLRSLVGFEPKAVTFSSGTQVAVVEVDLDTGMVEVREVIVVADCGTILNPMVVVGQQHGGVVHGIGNLLLEEVTYNEDGQPLATTFMDYLLPTAAESPTMGVLHRPHPTPLNPLGVKGTGEGATASAPAAVANAIANAVGIDVFEMPLTPARLLQLIDSAQAGEPPSELRSD
jgi:carbon-monoxide dehydrogenase large subunit